MTWEIVAGLIVLVSFIGTIGVYIYKLAGILAKLETAVDNLRETLNLINNNTRLGRVHSFTPPAFNCVSTIVKRVSSLSIISKKRACS